MSGGSNHARSQGVADAAAGNGGAGERSLRPTRRSQGERSAARERANGGHVYGALDLGTNNCRLLLARPSRRGFFVVDAFSRIIRLGEGLSASGRLSDVAMSRTIEALQVCSDKMHRRGVARSRLIATEACRIASNGAAFVADVRERTGLDLEIIDRETEARLAVSGCASLLGDSAEWVLVFDIGGGSSELIWLDLSRRALRPVRSLVDRVAVQDCMEAWTSLPIGVVTLSEQFGGRHVDEPLFEDMVEFVMEQLRQFEQERQILPRLNGRRVHLLGTSGTVTTVAGVRLGLRRYDRRRVDGLWLRTGDVRNVMDDLLRMSHDARVAQPCIGAERADLVMAGCAILEALLRIWPADSLRVADRGLREGILTTLMAQDVGTPMPPAASPLSS